MQPEVEFLWWSGCPSWKRALSSLREQMAAAGVDPDALRLTEIEGEADAERTSFPGSPTIRIEGHDLQPPSPEEPSGLTCRVYRRRDGRVSPLPDPDDVRLALEKARQR